MFFALAAAASIVLFTSLMVLEQLQSVALWALALFPLHVLAAITADTCWAGSSCAWRLLVAAGAGEYWFTVQDWLQLLSQFFCLSSFNENVKGLAAPVRFICIRRGFQQRRAVHRT